MISNGIKLFFFFPTVLVQTRHLVVQKYIKEIKEVYAKRLSLKRKLTFMLRLAVESLTVGILNWSIDAFTDG